MFRQKLELPSSGLCLRGGVFEVRRLYFRLTALCKIHVRASEPHPQDAIPEMATAIFAKTLENLQRAA
jgi:hypothetical protein